jgi:translocation and assembly module TamA
MPRRRKWAVLPAVVAAAGVACALPSTSAAQSTQPEVSRTASAALLTYTTDIRVEGGNENIAAAIKSYSILAEQQPQGAADLASLVARAQADQNRLLAVLYDEARYGGTIQITVADMPLDAVDLTSAVRQEGEALKVVIGITPGDEFRFGDVAITSSTHAEGAPAIDPGDYGLVKGEPARSSIIVAALDKIVARWRAAGYPFASIGEKEISADHERKLVDVRVAINTGAPAVYGWVSVVGPKRLSNRVVAEQSALQPGKRYHPGDLEKTRERLRKLESIESVRIIEGKAVDENGGIPITLEVKERKHRYIGATAFVTTLDGAEIETHWGHRNLFGEGESLRVEGSVSQLGSAPLDELEFDASVTLTKPGILNIDTNLFMRFEVEREANDVYRSDAILAKAGINRRFSPHLTGSVALESRFERSEDEFGSADYALLSIPGDVSYDSRDNRFNPASGMRAHIDVAPVADLRTGGSFVVGDFDAATYWRLDEDARVIVAARLRGGSIVGGTLEDTPTSYLFLEGGGNSVRGYEYRSIGPTIDGRVVGGRSFAGASLELRLRPTEQIGVVPFIDVATVSVDSVPKFSDTLYVGAGLGLRYFTPIGPIRLDVAAPLTERDDRPKFGVYVGLGQAF